MAKTLKLVKKPRDRVITQSAALAAAIPALNAPSNGGSLSFLHRSLARATFCIPNPARLSLPRRLSQQTPSVLGLMLLKSDILCRAKTYIHVVCS